MKQSRSPYRLVTLQMPNQMPLRIRKVREPTTLPFPFLHAILAEVPQARRICSANRLRRMRL